MTIDLCEQRLRDGWKSGDDNAIQRVMRHGGDFRKAAAELKAEVDADLAAKRKRISELERQHREACADDHPLTSAYSQARRALEEFDQKTHERRAALQRAANDAEARMHAHRDGIVEELRELSVSVQMFEQGERMAQERTQREAEHANASTGVERRSFTW